MSQPLLSICIPTYNRADYLRDALRSIEIQDSPEIEVVVADNASVDNTSAVVEEFKGKLKNLVYVKNPENVGFDGNVDIVVRAATGQYCWYLGDDDAIINGALSYILELCRTNNFSLISVADKPLLARPVQSGQIETYSSNDQIEAGSPSEAYINGYLPSALSMLIFRRTDWLEAAEFATYTPGWYYFETILKLVAKPGNRVLNIQKPMILTGQDMRWADGGAGLKIFIDCNRFLRKMKGWGYDKKTITAELENNARRFPIVLMQAKAKGLSMSGSNFALVRSFTINQPVVTRLMSEAIFFVPNPLIRLARALKKISRG